MGRFKKTARAQFADNIIYTPPWELMQAVIGAKDKSANAIMASAALFEGETDKIDFLDFDAEKGTVSAKRKEYQDSIDEITNGIAGGDLDHVKYMQKIKDVQRKFTDDKTTGDLYDVEQRHEKWNQWLVDNKQKALTHPDLFNRVKEKAYSEMVEGVSKDSSTKFEGKEVITDPQIATKYLQMLSAMKGNKTVKNGKDGYLYMNHFIPINEAERTVAKLLMSDPNVKGFMEQMDGLGDEGYMKDGQYINPLLDEADENGSLLNKESAFYDEISALSEIVEFNQDDKKGDPIYMQNRAFAQQKRLAQAAKDELPEEVVWYAENSHKVYRPETLAAFGKYMKDIKNIPPEKRSEAQVQALSKMEGMVKLSFTEAGIDNKKLQDAITKLSDENWGLKPSSTGFFGAKIGGPEPNKERQAALDLVTQYQDVVDKYYERLASNNTYKSQALVIPTTGNIGKILGDEATMSSIGGQGVTLYSPEQTPFTLAGTGNSPKALALNVNGEKSGGQVLDELYAAQRALDPENTKSVLDVFEPGVQRIRRDGAMYYEGTIKQAVLDAVGGEGSQLESDNGTEYGRRIIWKPNVGSGNTDQVMEKYLRGNPDAVHDYKMYNDGMYSATNTAVEAAYQEISNKLAQVGENTKDEQISVRGIKVPEIKDMFTLEYNKDGSGFQLYVNNEPENYYPIQTPDGNVMMKKIETKKDLHLVLYNYGKKNFVSTNPIPTPRDIGDVLPPPAPQKTVGLPLPLYDENMPAPIPLMTEEGTPEEGTPSPAKEEKKKPEYKKMTRKESDAHWKKRKKELEDTYTWQDAKEILEIEKADVSNAAVNNYRDSIQVDKQKERTIYDVIQDPKYKQYWRMFSINYYNEHDSSEKGLAKAIRERAKFMLGEPSE
ncbi:hypothetical protein N9933_01140 [bacterium]|nr:hypothetical protein [bacterium]